MIPKKPDFRSFVFTFTTKNSGVMGKRSRTKSLNTAELQDISPEPGPSRLQIDANEPHFDEDEDQECSEGGESGTETESLDERHSQEEDVQRNDDDASEPPWDVLDPEGFAGPSEKVVKPLTSEALAAFNAAQERTGVVYISRIPPGMRPTKVRHLMSQYGEVGRVYLQQEGLFNFMFLLVQLCAHKMSVRADPKRAYLRKKFTSTKKVHFTEGWVEFKDKRVARSVADILNAQPIGGKKGTRWHDDVWTMKYLPRFKWSMLTDQIGECLLLSPCSSLYLTWLYST